MATIIRMQDLDLSGLGLPVFDWQGYERDLSTLPYLDTWIDPERRGGVANGGAIDKMNGDTYAPEGAAPGLATAASLGGRLAYTFTGATGVGLKGRRRLASRSWSLAMALDLTPGFETAGKNMVCWQTANNIYRGLLRSTGGKLQVHPDFSGSFNTAVTTTDVIAPGPHIVIASWDDVEKRVSIIVDTPESYKAAVFPDYVVPEPTSFSRWIIGAANSTQNMLLGNLLIFNNSIDKDPYTVSRLLAGLKARHGIA